MSLGGIIRNRREQLEMTQDQVAAQADISKPYLSNIETGRAPNPPTDRVLKALENTLKFKPGELTRLAHEMRTPADVRDEHELLAAKLNRFRSVIKQLLDSGAKAPSGEIDLDALSKQVHDEGNVEHMSAGVAVPVINRVAAGYPQHFTDLDYPPSIADEYIRCPDLHDAQAFAARVVGDSMEPEYPEGNVIVFSPSVSPRSGDDCFVRFAEDNGTTFKRFYQDQADADRLQPLNSKYAAQTYPPEAISGLWPAVFRIQRLR